MKMKDLARALVSARRPREYGWTVATFRLPGDGDVHLARWLHPAESPKQITSSSVQALRAFLSPGDVAIDIGAHTGDTTLPIALAVGTAGTVFALEPNPYVFKVLAANAALNPDRTHIVPLMFAATPEDGRFEFTYSDEGYCNGGLHAALGRWRHGHFAPLTVEGRNLVRYLEATAPADLPHIRYIKIDTEGFDPTVVSSLRPVLLGSRPYLKSEVYKHLPAAERTLYFDDLRALGYRVFRCGDDDYRGEELNRNDMTRWRHFDIFAVPEECR